MRAAIIQRSGAIPQCETISDPVVAPGEQLIRVLAASVKNIDRMMAAGSHYDHTRKFPAGIGVDAVGILPSGARVYAGAKPPHGMLAEMAIIRENFSVPVPDALDDVRAAAIVNPAVSVWLALNWRAGLKNGETVYILGATGVTGQLAIQLSRHFGAGKIIAAGRNELILSGLPHLGADEVVRLSSDETDMKGRWMETLQQNPPDIVLDYLWGKPAEIFLDAITSHDLYGKAQRTRYIQIGEMAGAKIQLSASTLRSTALELYGAGGGGIPEEILVKLPTEIIPGIFNLAATDQIYINTTTDRLVNIQEAWQRTDLAGKRLVIIP